MTASTSTGFHRSSSTGATFGDAFFLRDGTMGGLRSDPADDLWPLEEWFSREDALPDGDTWHMGGGRARWRIGRAMRLLVASWR
jgi:hypothetical protein